MTAMVPRLQKIDSNFVPATVTLYQEVAGREIPGPSCSFF